MSEQSACMRGSTLTDVVEEALADAERTGMTGRTVAEWVSIRVMASPHVPLDQHFPAEGGGPCPTCGGTDFSPPAADTTEGGEGR